MDEEFYGLLREQVDGTNVVFRRVRANGSENAEIWRRCTDELLLLLAHAFTETKERMI